MERERIQKVRDRQRKWGHGAHNAVHNEISHNGSIGNVDWNVFETTALLEIWCNIHQYSLWWIVYNYNMTLWPTNLRLSIRLPFCEIIQCERIGMNSVCRSIACYWHRWCGLYFRIFFKHCLGINEFYDNTIYQSLPKPMSKPTYYDCWVCLLHQKFVDEFTARNNKSLQWIIETSNIWYGPVNTGQHKFPAIMQSDYE